jgi:hypothetical protein
MVHQTTLENSGWSSPEGNGKKQSAAAGVREGVGELLHDVVSLSELQAQLLAVDARESIQKAQLPLVLLGGGIAVALGAVPVLLLGLAEALVLLLEWERAVAYPLSGLLGLLLGGGLLYGAWRQASAVIAVFKRSQDELAENIRWIKYALTRGRRPPR